MSLNSSSILVDGTVATTGGTATSLVSKGNTLSQHNLILDDGSDLLAQTEFEATIKSPKKSATAPNGYTQARNTVLIKVPLALDNGLVTFNTVKVEIACDVETTDAEKLSMRVLAAQMLHDSDYVSFWDDQSVA